MLEIYLKEREVAVTAVREAAWLCRAVQLGITPEVMAKKDRSPVTVADFGSQALICRRLHEAFPNDPVIAEEDSSALSEPEHAPILNQVRDHVHQIRPEAEAQEICDWIDYGRTRQYVERFWTLDPIDGTKGFLRGEQYAIALALIVGGQIELAVLGCPNLNSRADGTGLSGVVMLATRGRGAWQLQIDGDTAPVRLSISCQNDPTQARFCESVESGHSSHGDAAAIAEQLGITRPPLRLDSQAKYAVVARGEADIYLRLPTRADYREKIWDHAAGALLVSEAGGIVTDINGKTLDFTHGPGLLQNQGVIAANRFLHLRVITELTKLKLAGMIRTMKS